MAGISNALSSSLFEDRSVAKYGNGGGDSTQTNKHRVTESTAPVFEFFPSRTTTRRWFISMERTRFQFPLAYFRISQILSSGFLPSRACHPGWPVMSPLMGAIGPPQTAPSSSVPSAHLCVCVQAWTHMCVKIVHTRVFWEDGSHLRLCRESPSGVPSHVAIGRSCFRHNLEFAH